MKNFQLFILFGILLLPLSGIAQKHTGGWKLQLNECQAGFGYIYQKEHIFEFGLKIEYIDK